MTTLICRFRKDERGATSIEYGLIAALIFVVIVGAITAVSGKTTIMFNKISTVVAAVT